MHMNWFTSLIYGLVSGVSEFLPISSNAHQSIFMLLSGAEQRDPVRDFVVHIAILIALYVSSKSTIEQLQRERHQRKSSRGGYPYITRNRHDLRLVQGAALPMLVVYVALSYIFRSTDRNLLALSVLLLLNGILLFIPGRLLQGNKDSRSMTQLDSVFLGISGGLGALPGISRVGCVVSAAITRGADRRQALNWAFLLSFPAIAASAILDIIGMFSVVGIPFWSSFFTYLLSAVGGYLGGYGIILLLRRLIVRSGFFGFSYYCWGAALLSFFLYLFAV